MERLLPPIGRTQDMKCTAATTVTKLGLDETTSGLYPYLRQPRYMCVPPATVYWVYGPPIQRVPAAVSSGLKNKNAQRYEGH